MIPIRIAVQSGDFDVAGELARLKEAGGQNVGALVTFTGVCRDEGGRLATLELEHYPGMAEEEIGRIAREAASRWPLAGITIVHRSGRHPARREHRPRRHRLGASRGGARRGSVPHGFPEDAGPVLEEGAPAHRRRRLDRRQGGRRPGGRALVSPEIA